VKRFWLKHIRRLPPVYYRGELQVLIKLLKRRPADLMHVYFGHTGVHLLPFIKEWDQPCVVSFHGMDIQRRPQQEGYDAQMQELLEVLPLVLARSRSLMEKLVQFGCPRKSSASIARVSRSMISRSSNVRCQRMVRGGSCKPAG
jgi:hypothetical protein